MLRCWRPRNVRWFSFLAGLCVPVLAAFVTVELIRPGVFLSREVALATVTRIEWWQNPGLLRGAMLALGLGAYLLAFAVTPRAVLASLISLAPAVVVGVMAQGRKAEQEYQSCANCRSFTKHKLEDYARAHQGWFPREGRDEWECLAKLIDDADDVHYFTSHAQTRAAETQWERTRTLSREVLCYRYNTGLKTGDPSGLIVLYYHSPGYWECSHHPQAELGRVCLVLKGTAYVLGGTGGGQVAPHFDWDWMNEADFQKAQARTLAHIRQRPPATRR